MNVCVLQPDYSASTVDYRHYDPRRDLAPLLPNDIVDHVFLDKRTTYRQIKECAAKGYDIFVNLCEGYLDWDVPSIDVIHALDQLGLPYTGPSAQLYDPPKLLMKYVAHTAGIRTPAHQLVRGLDDIATVSSRLQFPLFVKPAHAGDSLGIDEGAQIFDEQALRERVRAQLSAFDTLLVEEFIDGREFTVLVMADTEGRGACTPLRPVEFMFPDGVRFKTYALKTSDLHPRANVPVCEMALADELKDAAARIFRAFEGVGYARMDFRQDAVGKLFFLEANFTCSVFYANGYEGSADYILQHDGIGPRRFLEHIIAEGIARHRRGRRRYQLQGNALAGYGIVATESLDVGDVIFRGEERAHRIVTQRHVERTWTAAERTVFAHYAYPLSDEVFALWDSDPNAWAPQNHSCSPNSAFDGLNVVALRRIATGEELTIDYGESMHATSAPFDCQCSSPSCRGRIEGRHENSVTAREGQLHR